MKLSMHRKDLNPLGVAQIEAGIGLWQFLSTDFRSVPEVTPTHQCRLLAPWGTVE